MSLLTGLRLGYAGIFNFAHVAFFGIGSYVAAISTLQFGVPVWWDLALAVVVVTAMSGIVSSLALGLRGIYVALVTFAVTQLCVALINSQKDITGGPVGLIGLPTCRSAASRSAPIHAPISTPRRSFFWLRRWASS